MSHEQRYGRRRLGALTDREVSELRAVRARGSARDLISLVERITDAAVTAARTHPHHTNQAGEQR